jgi:hypothetical protein
MMARAPGAPLPPSPAAARTPVRPGAVTTSPSKLGARAEACFEYSPQPGAHWGSAGAAVAAVGGGRPRTPSASAARLAAAAARRRSSGNTLPADQHSSPGTPERTLRVVPGGGLAAAAGGESPGRTPSRLAGPGTAASDAAAAAAASGQEQQQLTALITHLERTNEQLRAALEQRALRHRAELETMARALERKGAEAEHLHAELLRASAASAGTRGEALQPAAGGRRASLPAGLLALPASQRAPAAGQAADALAATEHIILGLQRRAEEAEARSAAAQSALAQAGEAAATAAEAAAVMERDLGLARAELREAVAREREQVERLARLQREVEELAGAPSRPGGVVGVARSRERPRATLRAQLAAQAAGATADGQDLAVAGALCQSARSERGMARPRVTAAADETFAGILAAAGRSLLALSMRRAATLLPAELSTLLWGGGGPVSGGWLSRAIAFVLWLLWLPTRMLRRALQLLAVLLGLAAGGGPGVGSRS